ncbi:MAG: ribokinase [Planctomycetota bacterium]|nr:ribokinase [Planctomycetota bacterium]
MLTKPRIAVLGSINVDLVVRCLQLPLPGETIMATSSSEVPGGKGANQAVAAARLGADVAMIGRVGDDAFAKHLRDNLDREGIDTSRVLATESCSSGIALVAVEQSGENSIIVVPGANGRLDAEDVASAADIIRGSDLLMLQLEIPIEAVLAAIRIARAAGVRVVLDPAPTPAHFPLELFEVDVICPNQSEASAILGREVQSIADAQEAAGELHRRGVKHAVVTLGAQGAVASDGNDVSWFEPFSVKAIDTTAAGDAFAAALAVRLVEQDAMAEAVRYACAAGALAASRSGAQPAMPYHQEVIELLKGRVR